VAVSRPVARHYEHHLGLPPIDVIPNAFPLDRLTPTPGLDRREALAPFGVPPGAFTLLFCGRLVHEKGHRFFLEALAVLRRRGLRPYALIVGDGPLADDLAARIAGHGLEDQVRMHPAVPHNQLMRLVQATDLFVMASTHEGFPLTPAEAMAMGQAVLATRVGGIPELVEDGVSGVLVPPAHPEALAEQIAALMSDPVLRQRLGEAGRRRIVEHFSTDVLAERWERYYGELLNHALAGPRSKTVSHRSLEVPGADSARPAAAGVSAAHG
jgi:glycosyltransferase involved in cell wall biosynthesis